MPGNASLGSCQQSSGSRRPGSILGLARNLSRRLPASATLLVAGVALLATSPPSPPINSLDGRQSVKTTVTAGQPFASVRATFFVSDEALWSDDPEVTIRFATFSFSAAGIWVDGDGGSPSSGQEPDPPIVRLTVLGADSLKPAEADSVGLSGTSIDLHAICHDDHDCTGDYEVLVEWVDPLPDVEIRVEITASWLIQVQGPEELPLGAEVRVELAEPVRRDVTVLNDNVAGTVVVDAARPLAMWSIALQANEAAMLAETTWPVESRGSLTAVVSPEPGDRSDRIDDNDMAILLVTEADEQNIGAIWSRRPRHGFDPFSDCRAGAACVRRVTVVVLWFDEEPQRAARVDWQLNSGIVYHGGIQPAPAAEVRARIESETVINQRGPLLTASADGVIELDTSRGGITDRTILRLDIPREALAADLLGGPIPFITGTVTLAARSSQPIDGEPVSVLAIFQYRPDTQVLGLSRSRWRWSSRFELNGPPIELHVYPGTECRADRACSSTLTLETGGLGAPDPRLADETVKLTWRVEVRIRYPAGSDPPDAARLRLTRIEQ